MYTHIPVLLESAMQFLDLKPNANYVDATLGGGGYTSKLLESSDPKGRVLSIDLDTEAIENFKTSEAYKRAEDRSVLVHSNFRDIDKAVVHHNFTNIQGIVADIGLSSFQLDESGRGITFQKNELLDMRFDTTGKTATASFLLNDSDEKQIRNWLENYGEDPYASKIAKNIIRFRESKRFHATSDLLEVIKESLPKPVAHKWADSARRVFQALRIAVNHELDNLEDFLPKAFDVLNPGGRLIIVTFHSLEDRIVKNFFQDLAKGCVCPLDFPLCVCGKNPRAKILTKKPIIPDEQELLTNPRSKSSKLRAIEKI